MVVIAGLQTRSFQPLGSKVQTVGDRHPAASFRCWLRAGHDHVLASQNQIQIAGAIDFVRAEKLAFVVRRITAETKLVHPLLHLLGLIFGPLEIRRVELNALVTHLSYGSYRSFRIAL